MAHGMRQPSKKSYETNYLYGDRYLCYAVSTMAQEIIQDEAQQARVHFMNEAKVSYVASAEVYRITEPGDEESEIPAQIKELF